MSLNLSLTGKTALVTGASSGLGAHFAATLAGSGAEVVIAARRMERLEDVAEKLRAGGGTIRTVRLDVTDASSVQEAVATVGPLDIVVNNSGVAITKAALDHSEEDWDEVLDTNLKGAFLVASEVARSMRAAERGGSIINIASILGLRQGGLVVGYAVSKAGLIQLTKQLALEWARYGIRVNAIAPGYISTELNQDLWETDAGKALIKRVPQRRLGNPEDLDGALLLLASDASAYMTGSVVTVDGGHLCSSL